MYDVVIDGEYTNTLKLLITREKNDDTCSWSHENGAHTR